MYHFHPILIFLLFNLYYCTLSYPCNDHNRKDHGLSSSDLNSQDVIKNLANEDVNDVAYTNILCRLYGDCFYPVPHTISSAESKPKRLMSTLFHGIPKFGKRAFRSAFAGIPKFG